jgi:hypothetical protein
VVRFAVAVVAVELLLTTAVGLYLAASLDVEPYLTESELRSLGLGMDPESHETTRRIRFEALYAYDSNATLKDGEGTVWVSVRVNAPVLDLELRRRREESWSTKPSSGETSILDDSLTNEPGYVVRQRSPTQVRSEIVHHRGDRMLIVQVRRKGDFGPFSGKEASLCERRARYILDHMTTKLGWRR